ncbi:MAG: hypothetical protein GY841_20125, partial [FCB group bacterium]|nr:hypothetical protein [FCB group bacterium]
MALPVEYEALYIGAKYIEFDNLVNVNTDQSFGNASYPKVRLFADYQSEGAGNIYKYLKVTTMIRYLGTAPSTTLSAKLYSYSGYTFIADSKETYSAGAINANNFPVFTFDLDDYLGEYELGPFYAEIIPSGTDANVWSLRHRSISFESKKEAYVWNGAAWSAIGDPYLITWGFELKEFDITDDLRGFTYDDGKSTVDGKFVSGQGEITLNNSHGDYYPDNESSLLHGYWDMYGRIIIVGTHDSVEYPIFYAY